MSILSGPFSLFPDLDTITAEELSRISHSPSDHHSIENHLANRVLFPQTVPLTKAELDFDYTILTLAIKKHPEVFLDGKQNRIVIPSQAVDYFPPLTRLISAILLGAKPKQITQIWIRYDTHQEIVGSAVGLAYITSLQMGNDLKLTVANQVKTLVPGQLNLIPTSEGQSVVKFDDTKTVTILGGKLGLFVDLREESI